MIGKGLSNKKRFLLKSLLYNQRSTMIPTMNPIPQDLSRLLTNPNTPWLKPVEGVDPSTSPQCAAIYCNKKPPMVIDEILQEIFSLFLLETLCSVNLVNRQWHKICQPILQEKIIAK